MTKPLKKTERDRLASGYCPTAPKGIKPKRSYSTKSAAKRAMKVANRTAERQPGNRRATGVYECRCGDWHLTSEGSRA